MSRSYKKKAIAKTSGPQKDTYNRIVRKHFKKAVNDALIDPEEGFIEPSIKAKINDYDYVDQVSICENTTDCYCLRNYGRKKCKKK